MSVVSYENVLNESDISQILNEKNVIDALKELNGKDTVRFTHPLSTEIKEKLKQRLGIDLSNIENVPMRWIQGDTKSHIDHGINSFENTYVVYLTDSLGKLVVDNQEYPIQKGNAIVFQQGLTHYTEGVEFEPRLMIGPMSEMGFTVGFVQYIYYYSNETDASNNINEIALLSGTPLTIGNVTIGSIGSYTTWTVANGSYADVGNSYNNGYELFSELNNNYYYYLYPTAPPCFLEGTELLCQINELEKYVPIEKITKGMLVKTYKHGFVQVDCIGKSKIYNPNNDKRFLNRLFKCSKEVYPELTHDLFITGCHSLLVDQITPQQYEKTIEHLNELFLTDQKYRLIACVDERSEPWEEEGVFTVWHLALESNNLYTNYGVYVNGGLLVETCSINRLRNLSGMELV
jgi:hypothetical protein